MVEKKIDGSVVQTNVYDPARGLLSSGTDALGQAKVYTYALDKRPANLDYQNEVVATPDVTWQWDQRYPRMTAMIDVTGSTGYGYGAIGTTAANRLQFEVLPMASGSIPIQYSYDAVGRVFRRQIAVSGSTSPNDITVGRDAIGRVYGYVATSGTVGYFFSATHGRMTSTVMPNGRTLNIGYVDNDPVKPPNLRKLITTSGSTAVAQLDYTAINAMGRIGKITSSVGATWSGTMEYDAADQLTRANTTGTPAVDNRYTYDVAANVEQWQETTSGTSAYYPYTNDATNFTTAIKKGVTSGTGSPYLTYTKNANGNTTGWSDAISGKSETLTWDAENRLVSVAQSPANKEFVMKYDGRNRLSTIEEKLSGVTQKKTRLIWSGMEICEERDVNINTGAEIVLTKYFPDGEIQLVGGTPVPIWYYRDHLGSILETYSSAGTLQSQRRFDEWGKMTGTAPGAGASKKGYTGHYQPEGMDYVMAPYRWYSPTTRGWLSRDPIGEDGGINLYGYVSNNPINFIDPWGLKINIYGDGAFQERVNTALGRAAQSNSGLNQMIEDLKNSPFNHDIMPAPGDDDSGVNDPDVPDYKSPGGSDTKLCESFTTETLVHELAHAWDADTGSGALNTGSNRKEQRIWEEKRAMARQNTYREAVGKDPLKGYNTPFGPLW